MQPSFQHRFLIDAAEVASKLGHSKNWFYSNRRKLEKDGFPPPSLQGRWDNAAIDFWLDNLLPEKNKLYNNQIAAMSEDEIIAQFAA